MLHACTFVTKLLGEYRHLYCAHDTSAAVIFQRNNLCHVHTAIKPHAGLASTIWSIQQYRGSCRARIQGTCSFLNPSLYTVLMYYERA
jgi:hypothetical protein